MSMVTWSVSTAGRSTGSSSANWSRIRSICASISSSLGSRPRDLDAQAVVAGDADLGSHLDHRVERDRPLLAPRRDVDLGRRDHVDVVLADRLGVVLGKRLAKCLFAGHRRCRCELRGCVGAPCRAGSPGMRTSRAMRRNAASIALSNSVSSTSTETLTLLSSRDSTALFTDQGAYRRAGRAPPGQMGDLGLPTYA